MLHRLIGNQRELGLLLLRLVIGIIFMAHGMQKLFGFFGGGGITGTADFFTNLGIPFPVTTAWIVAIGETFGGLLLCIGLLTREIAVFFIVLMIGAIITVHGQNGFFITNSGFEYNFAIIGICLCLLFCGGGGFSMDRFQNSRSKFEFVKDPASIKLEPPEEA